MRIANLVIWWGMQADILYQSSTSALSNASFVLAALTAGGGAFGYAKTGSAPSIIAGSIVGFLCM